MGVAIYLMAVSILLVGLYAVVAKKNLIKVIVGVLVMDYAINLLLVLVGYRPDAAGKVQAPILNPGQTPADLAAGAVDPLPQAMVLTSIVIGLGITALLAAMAIRLYEKYGTFDMNDIRRLRG